MTKLRGLGSLVHVVLWVLKRGIWAAVPAQKMKSKFTFKAWSMHLQLGHRGPLQVELGKVGSLFLSARLENQWAWRDKPKDGVLDGPAAQTMSPLQHLYGDFFTPEMEHGIRDLQVAIAGACGMDLAAKSEYPLVMLSADLWSSFCGWKSPADCFPKGKQKQSG